MLTETKLLWPEDYGLEANHCRDVIEGCYDIPFSPKVPPIMIDIGANVGAFVRFAVNRWPGCTIHAYEPVPSNYRLLQRTVADLPDKARIHTYELAVKDHNCEVKLCQGAFNCGEWSEVMPDLGKYSVVVTAMAAKDLPKADILKMDVEGSELEILSGLIDRIGEFSAVMLEVHSAQWVQPIKDMFERSGFSITKENFKGEHRVELCFVKTKLLSK